MTEEERVKWEADRLAWVAPAPDPQVEAALVKLHLALREYAERPTEENAQAIERADGELGDVIGRTRVMV